MVSRSPKTRVVAVSGTAIASSTGSWGRPARILVSVAVSRARRYVRANRRTETSARASGVSIACISAYASRSQAVANRSARRRSAGVCAPPAISPPANAPAARTSSGISRRSRRDRGEGGEMRDTAQFKIRGWADSPSRLGRQDDRHRLGDPGRRGPAGAVRVGAGVRRRRPRPRRVRRRGVDRNAGRAAGAGGRSGVDLGARLRARRSDRRGRRAGRGLRGGGGAIALPVGDARAVSGRRRAGGGAHRLRGAARGLGAGGGRAPRRARTSGATCSAP